MCCRLEPPRKSPLRSRGVFVQHNYRMFKGCLFIRFLSGTDGEEEILFKSAAVVHRLEAVLLVFSSTS